MEERTIVLLGKTGVGKSATGNTILGRNAFTSRSSVDSVTERCADQQEKINGKIIRVVDTPGFFDTTMSEEELSSEIGRSVYLSRHGVHAFILVFQYGRITEQEEEMIRRMKNVFGEDVTKHMILLFTRGDEAGDDGDLNTIGNEYCRRTLAQCGGRYQIFQNKEPNPQQVTELLKKIDIMLRQNGGRCYTSVAYKEARRFIWEQYWGTFRNVFNRVGQELNLRQAPTRILLPLVGIIVGFAGGIIAGVAAGFIIRAAITGLGGAAGGGLVGAAGEMWENMDAGPAGLGILAAGFLMVLQRKLQ